jgi:Zn-finger nucleic acid-binding protein
MSQVHGQSHFHCPTCNTYEFPTEIQNSPEAIEPQGRITEFQCPKCELPLEVGLIHDQWQVCFCNNCRGFVTSSQTLGQLANQLRAAYQGPDDQPQPIDPDELEISERCPACLDSMEAHPYYGPGNVVIDTCRTCELAWLDHGELSKIVRAPGLRPDPHPTGNLESERLRAEFYAHGEARKAETATRFLGL